MHLAGLTSLRWLTLEHAGLGDLSALQPLVSAGCDIYGDDNVNKALLPAPKPAPSPGTPRETGGRLEITAALDGDVTLSYRVGQESVAVRQTFAGRLRARDGRLVLRRGTAETEVGRVDDTGPVLCEREYRDVCTAWVGRKDASSGGRAPGARVEPVVTLHLELAGRPRHPAKSLPDEWWAVSDEDLMPLALASPNQYDAGSCLFMANSGAMEILMNQHTPLEEVTYNGDTDLSERFLMNASDHVPASAIPYQITDILYTYNELGGSLLSRDYHFCAGWVEDTASGGVALSNANDPDAYVSCSINWFDQMPADWRRMLVPTPPAERTLIFVDPRRDENSIWRVALMGQANIEQIKYELRTKNTPVLVVYNHYLYWHTNVIVGYDDTEETDGCPMVQDSIEYFEQNNAASYATKIRNAIEANGGCTSQGVFLVRDSIYEGGLGEAAYDYSTDDVQVEIDKYSKRIIKLDYNWPLYLGNHTYTFHRK